MKKAVPTIILLAFVSASDLAAGQQDQGRLPNFVILLADDLGYCDTGLYGSHEIPTPNVANGS